MRGVHRAPVQVQLVGGTQLGQQQLVQRRPHSGFGPVPHPPPAGHPRDAERGGRELAPADPVAQHVHDPAQRGPVVDRPAPGEPVPARWTGRQQRLHALPQRVRNKIGSHAERLCRSSASVYSRHAELILKLSLRRSRETFFAGFSQRLPPLAVAAPASWAELFPAGRAGKPCRAATEAAWAGEGRADAVDSFVFCAGHVQLVDVPEVEVGENSVRAFRRRRRIQVEGVPSTPRGRPERPSDELSAGCRRAKGWSLGTP